MKYWVFASIIFLIPTVFATAAQAEQDNGWVTNRYQATHKDPQKLIAVLQPLFTEKARFSAMDQQVIIYSSKATLNDILQLLTNIDTPPLRFSVELSNTPQSNNTKMSSTNSGGVSSQRYTITEGQPLTLLRERRSQHLSEISYYRINLEDIADQQQYLQLLVSGSTETVTIITHSQSIVNDHLTQLSNYTTGPTDQWLAVITHQGPGNDKPSNNQQPKQWTTSKDLTDSLYIKVSVPEQ